MMKLGIMQPYLFPYIGYFQLIAAVDQFVLHDDVQWISGGWINRNRILMNGNSQYITLPLRKGSSRLNINQRELGENVDLEKRKILRRLKGAYAHAPYFKEVHDLIERCFLCDEKNVASFNAYVLAECCAYLNITTPIQMASSLEIPEEIKAESRVLEINQRLNAEHYINPIGGVELYDRQTFQDRGLKLNFLKTREIEYQQGGKEFVPNLSILDVLMFNSTEEILKLLTQFDLV